MRYIRAVSFLLLFLRATGARSEVLNLEVYDNGGCFNWIRVKYVQCAKFNVVNAKFLSRNESFELDIKHAKNATTPFEDVRKVEFTGGQVDYYPGHLFEFYEELTQVVIKGTNTSSIERGFFTFISELKVFESEDNPLKTLGPYIFEDGTSFGVIHLENNQLVEIHSDAFRTLTQTKSISLSRNQLTHVDPLWFQDLGQLIVFEMKQNLLHNIDGRVFGRLKLLKKLHLNNNFIEKLEKYTFKENSRLRLLDLSDNIILEIPTKLFSNILRLRDLKLTGNDCINATFHYQPISVIEEALDVSCKPSK